MQQNSLSQRCCLVRVLTSAGAGGQENSCIHGIMGIGCTGCSVQVKVKVSGIFLSSFIHCAWHKDIMWAVAHTFNWSLVTSSQSIVRSVSLCVVAGFIRVSNRMVLTRFPFQWMWRWHKLPRLLSIWTAILAVQPSCFAERFSFSFLRVDYAELMSMPAFEKDTMAVLTFQCAPIRCNDCKRHARVFFTWAIRTPVANAADVAAVSWLCLGLQDRVISWWSIIPV